MTLPLYKPTTEPKTGQVQFKENALDLIYNQQKLISRIMFNRNKEARLYREEKKITSKIAKIFQPKKQKSPNDFFDTEPHKKIIDELFVEVGLQGDTPEERSVALDTFRKKLQHPELSFDDKQLQTLDANIKFLKAYEDNKRSYEKFKNAPARTKKQKLEKHHLFRSADQNLKEIVRDYLDNSARLPKRPQRKAGLERPAQ